MNVPSTSQDLLFFHFPVLKAWHEFRAKSFCDRQSKCLRNQDGGDRFPWFGNRVNSDRQEPLGIWTIIRPNQDDSPSTSQAIFRERNSNSSGPAQGQNDGHVRFVYIEHRPVAKTDTRMGSYFNPRRFDGGNGKLSVGFVRRRPRQDCGRIRFLS